MGFIEDIVLKHYGMSVVASRKLSVGVGSNTYFIHSDKGNFILKNAEANEVSNPQNEPSICMYLRENGLPVSEFVKDSDGLYVWKHENEVYHMQKFVEGKNYEWNTAPEWLLQESARTLGRIHAVLKGYPPLPTGMGENFFRFMTPQSALKSYEHTFMQAKQRKDSLVEEDLNSRIELMKRFSMPTIQFEQLARANTHGDYFISQLICGENAINAIIDWTSACVHPLVWEIMRSYVYAAPECGKGIIHTSSFFSYVGTYLNEAQLKPYDIYMLPYVFYYQISVCDYYQQYYQSTSDNREIFLEQAILSTKMMKWFDKNIKELSCTLTKEFA